MGATMALTQGATLDSMLERGASIGEVGGWLDSLDADARWDAIRHLRRAGQRRLYDAAATSRPLTLEDFVPPSVGELKPVVHHGRNSLPLPGLNHFKKVFTRRSDGAVIGYNQSPVGPLIGPGYYTAVATKSDWLDRGAVVVDYYQPPTSGPVPEGWPRPRPNWLGIQVFVYFQTRDFMRRVSDHVTIGGAYKWNNVKLDQYFLLCREG